MATSQGQYSRKLAVILHADVVGSTTLVQKNEAIAHERIQRTFRQFSKIIANYGGTTHEIRGDALVAEFGRASDSVCAALDFQAKNSVTNSELTDDIRPEVRIGISLGEVVVADGTVTGSGVVLAQRLEQLASPGGLVVQGAVSETVPVRLPFTFESLGEQKLKGFDQPVRAFSVKTKPGELVPEPDHDAVSESDITQQDEVSDQQIGYEKGKPSIAVLPFANMSGDPEQEYFSDGITEDIITELSRFHELFVIARNSSFVFKNQSVNVSDIGQELGVQYVVEGSVRKSGQRARITAQLIDTATGNHLWADKYDRDLEDIFDVQDEVARTITSTLVGRVGHVHRDRIQKKVTSNLDAYDWFIQGREIFYGGTPEDNQKASGMFEQAIALDPDYAAAYALLSESYIRDWITFWNQPLDKSFEGAWNHANKAVALDDTDSQTHTALGVTSLFSGKLDQACFHLERALALNSSDTRALAYLSRYDVFTGNPDRAIERVNEALRYNPFGKYYFFLVPAYYIAHRYEDAIQVFSHIKNPAPIMLCWAAAAYAQAGDVESAHDAVKRFVAVAKTNLRAVGSPIPGSWIEFIAQRFQAEKAEEREHFQDGLRKAGVPE